MITDQDLSAILSELLDAIAVNGPVKIHSIAEKQIVAILPKLLEHKLESIALLSMEETAGIEQFYLETYFKQFSAVRNKLGGVLKELNCIFLQGFPRCLEYSEFYTPGMRSDVDIYVPASAIENFKKAAVSAGFDSYGFDSERIFILNDEQSSKLIADSWASKDVTLTYLQEVSIPEDLPIQIVDCYLPYVLREGKVYLLISLEVHHFYTESADINIMEENRQLWTEMGVDRCGAEASLYFNLVRIYNGVHANEKRMRLILDTACLLTNKNEIIDIDLFRRLLISSESNIQLISLCVALSKIHSIFNSLLCFDADYADPVETYKWLEKFYSSLRREER
jgi:hypothetical protein